MAAAVLTINEDTQIRANATFKPAGVDVPFDPPVVKLITRAPNSATTTTYTYNTPGSPIIRGVAGVYHAYLVLADPGSWWITWVGEGGTGPIVVGEIMIKVKNAVNV